MPRKKKDGRFINYYIDRSIYERLERYAEDRSQPMTTALERILDEHLSRCEAELAATQRYCPSCHILVWNNRCPKCDRRSLASPEPDDYCLLTQRDSLWAGVLEDCLRQNQIPYLTQSAMGAGMTAKMGILQETIRFYVRYAHFAQAKRLEEEFFSAAADENKEDENEIH